MLIKNPCWDSSPTVHALKIAHKYALEASTPEQKAWVIDQMVRALTGCSLDVSMITTNLGNIFEVETLGESREYQLIISDIPEWDKGIPV